MDISETPATLEDLAKFETKFALFLSVLLKRDPDFAGELLEQTNLLKMVALNKGSDKVFLALSDFETDIEDAMME